MPRKQTTASSYATSQTPTSPYASTSASTAAPNSAAAGAGGPRGDNRHSQPFLYSTARPPTGFSEVEESAWSSDPSRSSGTQQSNERTSPSVPRSGLEPAGAVQARVTSRKGSSPTHMTRRGNTTFNPFQDGGGADDDLEESLDDLADGVRGANTTRNGDGDGDGESAYTGDLYQRSDWAQSARASQLPTASAWSRSSYAGKTPRTPGSGPYQDNGDEHEYDIPPLPSPYGNPQSQPQPQPQPRPKAPTRNYSRKHTPAQTPTPTPMPKHVQYAYEQDMIMDSPGEITPGLRKIGLGKGAATPKSALKNRQKAGAGLATPKTALTPSTGLASSVTFTPTPQVPNKSATLGVGIDTEDRDHSAAAAAAGSGGGGVGHSKRQSTLPSVLDLDHLTPHRHQRQSKTIANDTLRPFGGSISSLSRSPLPSRSRSQSPAHFTGQIRAPSPSPSISPAPSSGYLLPPGQSQSPNAVFRADRDPFADPASTPAHGQGHGQGQATNHTRNETLDFSKPRFLSPEDQSKLGRMSVAPPLGTMPSQTPQVPSFSSQPRALLSPSAQNRLGRMSVAPARYTLPPQRKQVRLARESAISRATGTGTVVSAYDERVITPGAMSAIGPLAGYDRPRHGYTPDSKRNDHRSAPAKKGRYPFEMSDKLKRSLIGKWYLTWRPFISPCLSLLCALLLTVCHGVSDSSFGGFLKVPAGVFGVNRGGGVPIVLGVWGWCQDDVNDPICARYRNGDFANDDATFTIPQNSTLDDLSLLLTALTVLCWLLAAFQTITAFLHFYLFFALSIPFSHLITSSTSGPNSDNSSSRIKEKPSSKTRPALEDDPSTAVKEEEEEAKDPVELEVEMRVKCQRVPYEGYEWVWWAWWAHRRGPVGPLFGLLTGALGVTTFALTFMLKKDIVNATASEEVSLGHGAYIPLLAVILTLDTFLDSLIYLFKLRRNFTTFINPPDPSPTLLLLPPSDARQMQHVRPHTNASSIFVPRGDGGVDPQLLTNTRDTYLHPDSAAMPTTLGTTNLGTGMAMGTTASVGQDGDGEGPQVEQMGQMGLDEETVRWLAAYPTDEELVPLINTLLAKSMSNTAMGHIPPDDEESDFILSDVGLLYLRPSTDDPDEQALLVPPRGVIRLELMEDAHLDPVQDSDRTQHNNVHDRDGSAAHNSIETMIAVLSKTFWWNDMHLDIEDYIATCRVCRERREEQRLKDKYEYQSKRRSAAAAKTGGVGVVIRDGNGNGEVPWTGIVTATASDVSWAPGGSGGGLGRSKGMDGRPGPGPVLRQSQMAAEMAIAMRKAQEDAER
ncbi:hypothetical protein IAT40_001177 [Kwoniella sp. CBS 6097]